MTKLNPIIQPVLSCLFIAIAMAGCSTVSPEPTPIEATISDYSQMRTLIKKSIKEAEAKGQKEVHIHLKEDPEVIQPADLVTVNYTVKDPDGRLVYSTRPEMFARLERPYAELFGKGRAATGPEKILGGMSSLFPGTGHAVLGLRAGDHVTVEVPPEKGFGLQDESKIKVFPRQRKVPKVVQMPIDSYFNKFGHAPESGREVVLVPYFKSEVTSVRDGVTMLKSMINKGQTIDDDFGTTTLTIEEDHILISLDPVVGADFHLEDKKGVISNKDDDRFYVDFNHVLAGKPLTFDVTVLEMQKFSKFEKMDIPWEEDFNAAMDIASEQHKPVVLVLYAEWCGWSKKLLHTTFNDPRIKQYSDRLVWLKLDSDKEQGYKEMFDQTGFPMVVIMDQDGEVLQSMNGFQDGGTLALALGNVVAGSGS